MRFERGCGLGCFLRLRREKRLHARLPADSELPGGSKDTYRSHPLWTTVHRAAKFHLAWQRATRTRRHINVGEVRAFLRAELIGKIPRRPSQIVIAGDSQVALGALIKGRSASRRLNIEVAAIAPLPHRRKGSKVFICTRPTAPNPAGDPTRGLPVREPDLEKPSWWDSALVGDFEGMDYLA